MELVKKLQAEKDKNGKLRSYGEFKCPTCYKIVKKRLDAGKLQFNCGDCVIINFKHGESEDRLYIIWTNMKQRILNSKNNSYKNYGGRGITICPEWTDKLNGYINFRNWALSNGYTDNLQINRVFNDGNYEPSNCNFITQQENVQNQRTSKVNKQKVIEIRALWNTGNYKQRELAEIYNIKQHLISDIVNKKIWGNI